MGSLHFLENFLVLLCRKVKDKKGKLRRIANISYVYISSKGLIK